MTMTITLKAINFAVGSALLVHTVFKAIVAYINDNRPPYRNRTDGRSPKCGTRKPFPASQTYTITNPLPENLPSIVEIRRVLPKSCFESRVSTSMYYVIRDFVQVFAAYAVLSYLDSTTNRLPLRLVFAAVYWAVQGTFFFALFMIGHDCGHGSISLYPLLNDVVGTICNSFLMIPYYQLKLSHRNHHKNTGNMDKDEVFYPVRRSQLGGPPLLPGFALGLGWFIYLAVGYSPRRVNHFGWRNQRFQNHTFGCLCSLGALGITASLAFRFYVTYGLIALTVYYVMPLFVMGSYIVVVTFLNHSEVGTPWYSDKRWDFVRGQLSTIDRHYGIVHDVIHSVGTHQMHHMFPQIPHYRLEEATAAFRRAFPHLVRVCHDPILPAFVRMFRTYKRQSTAEDDAAVHVYF